MPIEKIIALNRAAEAHRANGNLLLASWLKSSAAHYEKIFRQTEKLLEQKPETAKGILSPKEEFTSDWFEYEEEYDYNFCG